MKFIPGDYHDADLELQRMLGGLVSAGVRLPRKAAGIHRVVKKFSGGRGEYVERKDLRSRLSLRLLPRRSPCGCLLAQ